MATAKTTKSITTYLPKDLAERLEVAKLEGTIDVKEVVKTALVRALDHETEEDLGQQVKQLGEVLSDSQVMALWQGQEGSAIEVACGIIERAAYPVITTPRSPYAAYELMWADDAQTMQARLDAMAGTEVVPLSIAFAPDGKVCVLAGWLPP